jgi:hypothetical protein
MVMLTSSAIIRQSNVKNVALRLVMALVKILL